LRCCLLFESVRLDVVVVVGLFVTIHFAVGLVFEDVFFDILVDISFELLGVSRLMRVLSQLD